MGGKGFGLCRLFILLGLYVLLGAFSSSRTAGLSSSVARPAEDSKHRRLRRARARARAVLRCFLDGYDLVLSRVYTAVGVLRGHHSKSALPNLALKKLKRQQAEMPKTTNQSWWCNWCPRWCKHNASFCQGCGRDWHVALTDNVRSGDAASLLVVGLGVLAAHLLHHSRRKPSSFLARRNLQAGRGKAKAKQLWMCQPHFLPHREKLRRSRD